MNDVMARGLIDNQTTLTIYKNGSFTLKRLFSPASTPDTLIAFDHDVDSMRRKSVTGRGTAALLTGGASLIASNNRGVVYVTVAGEDSGVQTFTTRNPGGHQLTTIRSLKAAADTVLAAREASTPAAAPAEVGSSNVASQLQQLADLRASGALTFTEFEAAKKRLLGT